MAEGTAELEQGTLDPTESDSPAGELPAGDEDKSEEEIWAEMSAIEAGDSGSPDELPPEGDEEDEELPEAAADEGETPEAAAPEPEGKGSKDSDPWAKAPEELRAERDALNKELERLQQADRSNRGRLSAMQHKLNDLEKSSRGAEPPPPAEKGNVEGYLESDAWKQWASEYPEQAQPIAGLVAELRKERDELRTQIVSQGKTLEAISSDRHEHELDEQLTALESKHADWREVADSEGFGPWLEDQPRHIREAAARNAEEIVDADEAADVIGRYKAFRSEQDGTPAQSGSPDGKPEGDNGNALSNRRQRQLKSSASARSRGPGVVKGAPPDDADESVHWAYFEEQDKRQAAGA